jgi:hypothetical protein
VKLYLVYRTDNEGAPAGRPRLLIVDYAHPIDGWLEYRLTGTRQVHWVPSSTLRDAYTEPEPGDPDPMRPCGLPS